MCRERVARPRACVTPAPLRRQASRPRIAARERRRDGNDGRRAAARARPAFRDPQERAGEPARKTQESANAQNGGPTGPGGSQPRTHLLPPKKKGGDRHAKDGKCGRKVPQGAAEIHMKGNFAHLLRFAAQRPFCLEGSMIGRWKTVSRIRIARRYTTRKRRKPENKRPQEGGARGWTYGAIRYFPGWLVPRRFRSRSRDHGAAGEGGNGNSGNVVFRGRAGPRRILAGPFWRDSQSRCSPTAAWRGAARYRGWARGSMWASSAPDDSLQK